MTAETNQPTEANAQPDLKQVLGALLFASRKPIATGDLLGVLTQTGQLDAEAARSFVKIRESDVRTALEQLKTEFAERKLGMALVEAAGGFRLQTDPAGGPWVRQLLNLDKPARLSKPALETLAIIAYRQPVTRAEIEALRGVNVDAMMRHLLELQLIRITGRSDLPGRPLMYGTTQLFLEHFGLSSVKNLPGIEQLSRRDAERVKRETDDGRRTPDASPEKTEDGLKTDDGHQTTDTGPEKTEDEQKKAAEANAQLPTSNIEHPMEEQKTDDPQRKAEGAVEEAVEEEEKEDEYDEEDDSDEDDEDEES